MKRILIALMALVLTAGAASAQVRFGIKAGANFNKIRVKDGNLDPANSCGFNAGVMTEFTVPIVGLNFDASLLYSRMNNETGGKVIDGKTKYGKNFLEIPINIKYKFNIPMVSGIVAPYIFTGPSFAFKLDKTILDRTFQSTWNVGIGVQLIRHLQISGSYGFGMNNIMQKVLTQEAPGADLTSAQIKAYNNYWTVSAAWLF